MKHAFRNRDGDLAFVWLAFTLFVLFLPVSVSSAQAPAAKKCMVATVHPLATDAALTTFRAGGNAVDAAVAAAVTLGVVDGHNSGLGGGCFLLIRTAGGEVVALDGREMAPAAATRDMFLRDGRAVPELSTTGPLAVGIPGAFAAYEVATREFGRRPLAHAVRAAAAIADAGFAIDRVYARNLAESQPALIQFAGSRALLLKPDGAPYAEGDTLRLPDLARSYRALAEQGSDWFYRGEFAEKVAKWMREHGGLITQDDFANYRVKRRSPIETTYRGHTILGFPPPSSGGIHVAQMLNILEHFDVRQLVRDDPMAVDHLLAEAMKRAFADRAHWLGDADFAKVPRGLATKEYAKTLAATIDLQRSVEVPSHGVPADWQDSVYGKHTTHIATADAEGNWVALTATVNTSFGSKVVVPGTGIVLNNEMDDFSAQPGVPNAFGLVGADANAVAPGKRPLSSMSPTIVLRDGKPVLTVGAAGGPKIITQVLQAVVRYIDGELPLERCVGDARLHHQWKPNQVFVEQAFGTMRQESLRARGHAVEVLERGGVCQAITQLPDGSFIGISDPRVPGKAAGY